MRFEESAKPHFTCWQSLCRMPRHFWRFWTLTLRAGLVWNCVPDYSLSSEDRFKDWRRQVIATPLRYELEANDAEWRLLLEPWEGGSR